MKPYRSMLFVPGHKGSWAEKALKSGTDAIILDLEDSVPVGDKDLGRKTVAETLERLDAENHHADIWVRPNPQVSGIQHLDFEAVTRPGLTGYFLPKVFTAQDIKDIDAVLTHIEAREGLPVGGIELIVSYETAESMNTCEDIAAASPRIVSLLGATGPGADVGRSLGFEFTPQGLESLYLRSRILLAGRANGLHHNISGVWQDLADTEGCKQFYEDQRGLGYRGVAVIHPSHVAIAHEVFTPTDEEVAYSRRLIDAFRAAEADGSAAVDFEGQHIDIAHVKTAEGIIALAKAIDPSA
jgi:citrate lyase subunit beta/citryl-CoA lyase